MTAPCLDCPHRILACWSACDKYRQFKEQNEAIKEARKADLMPALVETESYRRFKQKAAKVPKKFRVFK